MKQFGLRYLYKHLGKALKEIPFEITNHNRVIAVVASREDFEAIKEMGFKFGVIKKETPNEPTE